MGARLAAEALARGHRVTVVAGPISERLPARARVIRVERADEMARALRRQAPRADAILMAAAVADFRAGRPAAKKTARRGRLRLELAATPDIIGSLPRRRGQVVVGFALETGRVVARAKQKLREKRLDLVLAQQANSTGAPFGRQAIRAWLLSHDGIVKDFVTASKTTVARRLFDVIEALWHSKRVAT